MFPQFSNFFILDVINLTYSKYSDKVPKSYSFRELFKFILFLTCLWLIADDFPKKYKG